MSHVSTFIMLISTITEFLFLLIFFISGTTWLQETLFLICHEASIQKARAQSLDDRCTFMEFAPPFVSTPNIDTISNKKSPCLIKTHLPAHFFDFHIATKKLPRIIVGMRNIKDTLVSYYHFYRMNTAFGNFTGTWDEFFELFKNRELFSLNCFIWRFI